MNDKRPASALAWVFTVLWALWVAWLCLLGRAEWGRSRDTVHKRLMSAPVEKKLSPQDASPARRESLEREETP